MSVSSIDPLAHTGNKILPLEAPWHFVTKVERRHFQGCLSVKIAWGLGLSVRCKMGLNEMWPTLTFKKNLEFLVKSFFFQILKPFFNWNSILL